ncbi:MAG TPA: DNA alkylation repair protein [Lachnospiraceae bacterium]|nr:DNA alkylation repair protein [Lachnospiraceae bacterium]
MHCIIGLGGRLMEKIVKELFEMQDEKYRDFQSALIPGSDLEKVIGIRTPLLRKYAKNLPLEDAKAFLLELPHEYFDENQLHAFIVSEIKDIDACIKEVNTFLPYVDNWATCDQMSPVIFKKHKDKLLVEVKRWIASSETYTVRFGIKMLMQHFLDEDFNLEYPEMVAKIQSEEYYVKMMIAWYFATALAKQYDSVIPFIEEGRLEKWTHNKAIQKSIESYRITTEQKKYLRSLKK